MKIYITGGTGFVGSHLARKLNERHEVTVGGLNPETSVLDLEDDIDRERIDVTDRATLDFSGYDCVFHLVALSPLKKPPVPYEHVHVDGTRNVVEKADEADIEKYFHMSALGADPEATTDYLRTKGKAEKIVEGSKLDSRIFRPSTIFGEGGQFLNFVSGLTAPYITVLPGKNTRFQPIHVDDITDIMIESLEDKYAGEKFDLGGPEKFTLGEIAQMIDRSNGRKLKVLGLPMPFFLIAMMVSEQLPLSPFGIDQYRSLKDDNIPEENMAKKLGCKTGEMKELERYLN